MLFKVHLKLASKLYIASDHSLFIRKKKISNKVRSIINYNHKCLKITWITKYQITSNNKILRPKSDSNFSLNIFYQITRHTYVVCDGMKVRFCWKQRTVLIVECTNTGYDSVGPTSTVNDFIYSLWLIMSRFIRMYNNEYRQCIYDHL